MYCISVYLRMDVISKFTATSFLCYMCYKGTEWRIKIQPFFYQIADFGLSNLYQKDKLLQTFCGSPLYASPEIVNGRPYRGPEVSNNFFNQRFWAIRKNLNMYNYNKTSIFIYSFNQSFILNNQASILKLRTDKD